MDAVQYEAWAREHPSALFPKLEQGSKCPGQHKRWTHNNVTRTTYCTDCSRAFSGLQLVGPLPD